MALAAIHNGADAIYIGFPGFNARGRSHDFEIQELRDIIETCHLYGVKVNLAFNVVIFESEIPQVIEAFKKVLPLGPDALIIQDLGLVQLVRQLAPDQRIHASTQMTITNDLAIDWLQDLDIKRFVLGRENSLDEIKLIKSRTDKELEVFVHGALCVSYSGQCFTSESLGGRSANRGQCAQSCRFGYELIVDGTPKTQMDKTFLVSPKDLCGLAEIPALMDIGVASFKVEGRLKTPDYVAGTAREYRAAMDRTLTGQPRSPRDTKQSHTKQSQMTLATHFSRGFHSGWLHGVDHQRLVDGKFSSHRGAEIGSVLGFAMPQFLEVEISKQVELNPGDGLLWTQGSSEWGSFIFSIDSVDELAPKVAGKPAGLQKLRLGIDRNLNLNESPNWRGAQLYWNHNKDLKKDLAKSYQDKALLKRIPINIEVELKLGQPLWARISDGQNQLEQKSLNPLSLAQKHPLSEEQIRTEFLSLGGSPFQLNDLEIRRLSSEDLFLTAKELKGLRQSLIHDLMELRKSKPIRAVSGPVLIDSRFQETPSAAFSERSVEPLFLPALPPVQLNLLLRNKNQVEWFLRAIEKRQLEAQDFQYIVLDFEFGRDTLRAHQDLAEKGFKVGLATTRILKPQEYSNLKNIASQKPKAVLVRNLGALAYFQKLENFNASLLGDFSLNVTNHLSANYLLKRGLKSVCLSYDLNDQQIRDLLSQGSGPKFEVTLHQFMPSFHMEHCVFAAFLSQGSSYKDCGKPCEKHSVQLRDQFNNLHLIKADHECRNTMFNSQAQTALKYVSDWRRLGLGSLRYEALFETEVELITKLMAYLKFLKGVETLEVTLSQVKAQEKYGLAEGSLARAHKYQSRKQ